MALAVPESKIVYTGDGSTEAFPIPFPIGDDELDELVVFRRLPAAVDGDEDEELSEGVDYDLVTDAETGDRSVTFDAAPTVATRIAILRRLPIVQETVFDEDGEGITPPATIEAAVDRLTRQLQMVRDDVDRALKMRHTGVDAETGVALLVEKIVPNAALTTNEAGDGLIWTALSELGGDPELSDFAQAYDFHAYFGTVPPEGEGVSYALPRSVQLPASLTGSRAVCATAPTTEQVFNITDNGATVGTITFAADATTATITGPGADLLMTAGDRLAIVLDSAADLAMSGVSITILARTPAG